MSNSTTTSAISINIVSAVVVLLAMSISLVLFIRIVYRLVTMHIGPNERIALHLTLNTLCAFILMFIVLFLHVNVSTLCSDLNMNSFRWRNDSTACRFCGYVFFSVICSVFWSYALQVFFRFIRVVYPMNSWINHIKIYLFLFIPLQWIIAFVIVIPLITRLNGIHLLLPNETYCGVQFDKFFAVVYASVAEVWIPIMIISACYFKITRTIRHRSSKQLPFLRNRKDVKAIHRIIIMIFLLSLMNIPTIVYLVLFWISSNALDPLIYRITWLSLSIGSLILCVLLPQLVMHASIYKDR